MLVFFQTFYTLIVNLLHIEIMERELKRPHEHDNLPFTNYIRKVPGVDFMAVLRENLIATPTLLKKRTQDEWNFRYETEKWSLKEVLLHIIDTERIFAYRALRFARHDQTPLQGFEQDDYIPFLNAADRSAHSIIEEYEATRNATICMFKHFSDDTMLFNGSAGGNNLNALMVGFIIAGHEIHHIDIVKQRYLRG